MTEYCVIRKDYLEDLIECSLDEWGYLPWRGKRWGLLKQNNADFDNGFPPGLSKEEKEKRVVESKKQTKQAVQIESEYTEKILGNTLDGWRVVPDFMQTSDEKDYLVGAVYEDINLDVDEFPKHPAMEEDDE